MVRSLSAILLVASIALADDKRSPLDANAIWRRSLVAQRFDDIRTVGTLTTRFANGDEVVLEVELLAMMQADGVSRMGLTRVLSGNALLNSTFLNVEHPSAPDDLWVYLPGVGTPRRLVSGNLADSYLGSEFRYGDLVQREPEAYAATLREDERIDGEPCAVIEIVPKDPRLARDSGLAREILWILRTSFVERKVEQYDRRNHLLKVMELPRIFVDSATGKVFPIERRILNVQSGTISTAIFKVIRPNVGLSPDLFTPRHLTDHSW